MQQVFRDIERVAQTDSTVLLLGETGTGKELIARAIHRLSRRRDAVMVKVNCGALPSSLAESELFGHERGAFTGAVQQKRGRFELANNGTIFLDEVGELSTDVQVKLLRVLQEQELERLGSTRPTKVNIRVIAATNRDLQAEVQRRSFPFRLVLSTQHLSDSTFRRCGSARKTCRCWPDTSSSTSRGGWGSRSIASVRSRRLGLPPTNGRAMSGSSPT